MTSGVGNRPPSLEETDDQARLITWLRIRSPEARDGAGASSRQLSIHLSWVGINAARVVQRSRVPAEILPKGMGEPDQRVRLANRPVIRDELRLSVNGEPWQAIDDLNAAPPEVPGGCPRLAAEMRSSRSGTAAGGKVFVLDPESGEIRFGDGTRGARPPLGANMQAAYAYGGGEQGMVAIGSINKGPPGLPGGIKVGNPVPTWGGSPGEEVADAERHIPSFIRHRDRLVSEEDFRDILRCTPGVDLGRSEILPLFHPAQPRQASPGVVTLLVIPRTDPEQPNAPRPDQLFLQAVCAYLAPRRILTTELHVRGPEYRSVWVSVGIEPVPGYDEGPVRERVERQVQGFLSPLTGGFEGKGWPLGKVVDALEISAAVTRVEGVAKVLNLRLGESAGPELSEVLMEGLQLPRLGNVIAVVGDPPALEEIRGELEEPADGEGAGAGLGAGVGTGTRAGAGAEAGAAIPARRRVVPVPVVPDKC